jgi:hypothetical protein
VNIWAVAMVRNEADIIEPFVRHTLGLLDGIAILDHASTDGTFEILAALKAEGLEVARLRTADKAFFQGAHITQLARECFGRTAADYVFPLDADEFIRTPSRGALEAALASVPPGVYPVHYWRSYVPAAFQGPFGPDCLRFRVREERFPRHKAILPRAFAGRQSHVVAEGSHWVVDIDTATRAPCQPVPDDLLGIAHCPVRSASQLEAKIRAGYAALQAAAGQASSAGSHWRELIDGIPAGGLGPEELRMIAANYGGPRSDWGGATDLVEDPVALCCKSGSKVGERSPT